MKFTVYVEPVGKARPRYTSRGGKVITYTPAKTRECEEQIRLQVLSAKEYFESGIPIRLDAIFYLSRPKSLKKSIKLPAKRPDWDNLGKTLSDSCEGFLYGNDSQITTVTIRKRYGIPPRIEFTLEEDNLEV